ncbi:hypothetical protein EUGRSUZ_C04301 [Eucalyptus grandis]|uniref:Uncharacterized protein n=2 Tax=Eucalyptus grandis TaxID=71139 RepID=A0A059CXL7_EUCGR|nr:hypothetical protein EUGRSUZ_C04301 [Eucalyptus grandis]
MVIFLSIALRPSVATVTRPSRVTDARCRRRKHIPKEHSRGTIFGLSKVANATLTTTDRLKSTTNMKWDSYTLSLFSLLAYN